MSELIERYVHQVGLYLPRRERADIVAELRSQLIDERDDRYGAQATDSEIASLLTEKGHPQQVARGYTGEQVLIGADLYPLLLMVLRPGWIIVPMLTGFLSIFGTITAEQSLSLYQIGLDGVLTAAVMTVLFTGLVVLFFAAIEQCSFDRDYSGFNPLELRPVNHPHSVDRTEFALEIAVGLVAIPIFLYFLVVGGLTTRFNLSDPGTVIPVAPAPLIALVVLVSLMIAVQLFVLRRGRWDTTTWLFQTVLEIGGAVSMYFAVYKPLLPHVLEAIPALADLSFSQQLPEILVILMITFMLIGRGVRQVRLWQMAHHDLPVSIKQQS